MLGQQQLLQSNLGELLNLLHGFELFCADLIQSMSTFVNGVCLGLCCWVPMCFSNSLLSETVDFIFELVNKTVVLLICLALVGPGPQLVGGTWCLGALLISHHSCIFSLISYCFMSLFLFYLFRHALQRELSFPAFCVGFGLSGHQMLLFSGLQYCRYLSKI